MGAAYERYGFFKNGLVTVEYPGAEGSQRMRSIMGSLRADPPAEVAGLAVDQVVDYQGGAAMPVVNPQPGDEPQTLPPADVVEFQLQGGNKLIIRPSGTEPKVKAYAFARAAEAVEADALLTRLQEAAQELLS